MKRPPRALPPSAAYMTSEEFFELIKRRTRANARHLDAGIEARAAAEVSILMADSSGFTRKAHEHGILSFLSTMTKAYDILVPLLTRHRGLCLAQNADNILAIFPAPPDAVRAAVAMNRAMARRNRPLPDEERFHICIGIHHGRVLRLRENVFGDAVNIAAKLGEDLAGKDEILVTGPVARRLRKPLRAEYQRSVELGGRNFEIFRVPAGRASLPS